MVMSNAVSKTATRGTSGASRESGHAGAEFIG